MDADASQSKRPLCTNHETPIIDLTGDDEADEADASELNQVQMQINVQGDGFVYKFISAMIAPHSNGTVILDQTVTLVAKIELGPSTDAETVRRLRTSNLIYRGHIETPASDAVLQFLRPMSDTAVQNAENCIRENLTMIGYGDHIPDAVRMLVSKALCVLLCKHYRMSFDGFEHIGREQLATRVIYFMGACSRAAGVPCHLISKFGERDFLAAFGQIRNELNAEIHRGVEQLLTEGDVLVIPESEISICTSETENRCIMCLDSFGAEEIALGCLNKQCQAVYHATCLKEMRSFKSFVPEEAAKCSLCRSAQFSMFGCLIPNRNRKNHA